MFNKNSGQFSDATNKTVDATYDFLQTSLKSIEKLTEIHLSASKRILVLPTQLANVSVAIAILATAFVMTDS